VVRIEGEVVIDRPVEVVFDCVADERNEPSFNPALRGVVKLPPGPIGAGTRFRAESTARGRSVGMTIEFTAFERPTLVSSATHMDSMDVEGTLTFEPAGTGTRLRWVWDLHPRGVLRVAGPLVARMGRRQEEAVWAGLKAHLEAGEPA
jgi:uncharacterized protein YndB with AHSA1/START domain